MKYTDKSITVLNPVDDSYEAVHTLSDGDLLVGLGGYQVVANGRHYDETGHNHEIDYTTAYVVPADRRDTPGTPENKAFTEIMQAIKLENLVEQTICTDQKVKGRTPGHLYLHRDDQLYLYLGRLTLVDPTNLQTLTGHIYQKLTWLRHQDFAIGPDGRLTVQTEFMVSAPRVTSDGTADYTVRADGKRDRTVLLKVTKNPATFKVDMGEYTTTAITGLQVRLTEVHPLPGDVHVTHQLFQECDAPVTLMPAFPAKR